MRPRRPERNRCRLGGRIASSAAAAIGCWLVAEWLSWRASSSGVERRVITGRQAVVVLGYRNTGRRANRVNRWRVRSALRSISATAASSTLYFCGGGVGSAISEAQVLAEHAVRDCGYRGAYRLEDTSRTTLENIENVIPMIAEFDAITIVSNSGHTLTGRECLRRLRHDLAERLVRAEDYRFGEIPLTKIAEFMLLPLRSWLRRQHRPRNLPHTQPQW